MKTRTRILAGIIISGILATSVAQAAGTYPTIEEFYSGLGATEAQQAKQTAAQQSTTSKAACKWRQEAEKVVNQLHAPYPGDGDHFGEKAYLAAENQNFVC